MENGYLRSKRKGCSTKALFPPTKPCFISMSAIAVCHNTSISYHLKRALQGKTKLQGQQRVYGQ